MYLHCGSREKRKLFAVCADAIPAFLYWRRAKVRACPLAAAYNPGMCLLVLPVIQLWRRDIQKLCGNFNNSETKV